MDEQDLIEEFDDDMMEEYCRARILSEAAEICAEDKPMMEHFLKEYFKAIQ